MRRSIVTPCLLLCAAATTSCGSSAAPQVPAPGSSTPVSTPTPLLGTPFSSAHFTTVVPTGWVEHLRDATEVQKFATNGAVEYLVEQQPPSPAQQNVNDVVANINVVLLDTPVPDDRLAAYLTSVSVSGATNISSAKPFTIDGATGQYVTYDRDISGTPGESEDLVVNHDGATYDIVIITSQYAYPLQQASLQAVLSAWRWV